MNRARIATAAAFISILIFTSLPIPTVVCANDISCWNDVNPTAYLDPPSNPPLDSIYMFPGSPLEGWAVGDSFPSSDTTTSLPAILHYDGSVWSKVAAPIFPNFPSTQSGYSLKSINFGPPGNPIDKNDGWAVGFNATADAVAIHWDGISWRVQTSGFSRPSAGPLLSVFMVSPTDVWAVGQDQVGSEGTIWHWTGTPGLGGGWTLIQLVPATTGLQSVFMVNATEGWAVGNGGIIMHYFGGGWTTVSSPVSSTLTSVFMISPTEGWAVGSGGVIVHYESGIWTGPVSPGTTSNDLFSVFLVSSGEGWAVGDMGTIIHYSGGTWTALPTDRVPTAPVAYFQFTSVFSTSSNDGWIVGTAGTILHFDGNLWGTLTSPTINNFTSISFGTPLTQVNPNDGWAVGNASMIAPFEPTVFHWNGFVWTKGVVIGATNNLNSVFMLNTSDVWTVGGGPRPTASCAASLCPIILNFNGGSWSTITPPPGSYILKSVFMVSSSEGWAVGQAAGNSGIILHYTTSGGVGSWGIFPAPPTNGYSIPLPSLNSIFMLGQNEGWAVGDNATILHYTVSSGVGNWNPVAVSGFPGISTSANLTSIFMTSPTSGWIVGGIQAQGSYSAGPVILSWDGFKWSPVATTTIPGGISTTGLTSATLKSVYCSRQDNCWAVGLPGKSFANLMHWDGYVWNYVVTTPALIGQIPPILSSVYIISQPPFPDTGWIVGGNPGFLPSILPSFPTPSSKPLSTILECIQPQLAVTTVTSTSIVPLTTATPINSSVTAISAMSTISTNTTQVTVPPPTNITIYLILVIAVLATMLAVILLLLSRRKPRPRVVWYTIPRRR